MVSRIISRVVVIVVACAVVLGGAAVAASATGLLSPAPTGSADPNAYALPAPQPVSPAPGLSAASTSPVPDGTQVQQQLSALNSTGVGTISYCVTDLTGAVVAASDAQTGRIPASSWKLTTMLAVLTEYNSDQRFNTTVVSSPTGIVLVGGGDPLLTAKTPVVPGQATLQNLATQVAQALKANNQDNVTLGYDDSLFAGPQWNPAWPASDVGNIAPVSPLAADAYGGPDANISAKTAATFKTLLAALGITVTSVQAEKADSGAAVLGTVASPPLGQLVQYIVNVSDNYGAEVLLRHVSLGAGGDGSITSAEATLTSFLQSHQLWDPQMVASDGSGMSMADLVTPEVLAGIVRMAYGDPRYSDILAGMPVAGVDGTLYDRFNDPSEASGRGVLHAKTGTQTQVRTLTGYVQTNSGGVLAFSFMLNNITTDSAALNWLDQAGAVLASS